MPKHVTETVAQTTTGGGTIKGITQLLVNEAAASDGVVRLEIDGGGNRPLHVFNANLGLDFMATEFNGMGSKLDLRSTRAPSLVALAAGNDTYVTQSGDVIGGWHIGGSHRAALVDCAQIFAVAAETFSTGATASGTEWEFWTTPTGTETKVKSFRMAHSGSFHSLSSLVVGAPLTTAPVNSIDVYAYSAAPFLGFYQAAGSRTAPAQTAAATLLGNWAWRAYTDAGAYTTSGIASIRATAIEAITAAAQGSYMRFYVTPATTATAVESLRIYGAAVPYVATAGVLVVGDGTSFPTTPGAGASVLAPNGAAATPTYAFTSDPDTGMYRVGANQLGLAAGGAVKLTIGTASLTLADAFDIVLNTTTGTKIGTGITQKIGVYNATPIAQRAGAAQAAVATTGATLTTPFGYTTAAQADGIVTLLNELRAWAVAQGWIKGAA